ncbi:MAG: ferrous iron transport protein A [Clostridiales bacterium]|jgi:Fe2+ transport system protein FeoA|nr:ferrous iron transport protein A [Clostridiales bacterium]
MSNNLYSANKRTKLQVTSVPMNALLESIGIRSGTRVRVQNRYAFGGPVLLRVEDAFSVALGKEIATQIGVLEI